MRFLFYSPHALADSCSGAAKDVQTLLEELTALGHSCLAVTGTLLDGPSHQFLQIQAIPPARIISLAGGAIKVPVREVRFQGIEHVIVGKRGTPSPDFRAYEEIVLKQAFLDAFASFRPDVFLTYGGFVSNFFAGQYAVVSGCKSVLYAASDSYQQPSDVLHVNRLAVVSTALHRRIAQVTQIPAVVISALVRTAEVRSDTRAPEFITFINPLPAKGLVLAVALARECQKLGRPYKFLFVESRGTRQSATETCPDLKECSNVTFVENISDMKAIYARTKLLLYPSVWFEAAGRVPIEANANGIPVLASRVGGIPEMLGGAGYLFDPPQALLENWQAPVPQEYLQQWLKTIDRLYNDPEEYASATRRARDADSRYDLRGLAKKFADAMMS